MSRKDSGDYRKQAQLEHSRVLTMLGGCKVYSFVWLPFEVLTYMLDDPVSDYRDGARQSTHKMINSTAFPNVTFIKAPTVSPIRRATLSVA